jgi:hypothetical protein
LDLAALVATRELTKPIADMIIPATPSVRHVHLDDKVIIDGQHVWVVGDVS